MLKKQNIDNKKFLHYCLTTLSFFFIIGVAFGFGKYVGNGYYYFSPFPNYLDCLGLILSAIYLTWRALKK